MAFEEIVPSQLFQEDLVHNVTTTRELTKNDRLGRQGNIVGCTHRGISWCDYGHKVKPVTVVDLTMSMLMSDQSVIVMSTNEPLDSKL